MNRDHYLNELAQQRAQLEADVQQRLDEYSRAWQALAPLALSKQVVAPLWKGLQQARAEQHLLQNAEQIQAFLLGQYHRRHWDYALDEPIFLFEPRYFQELLLPQLSPEVTTAVLQWEALHRVVYLATAGRIQILA
uniref:Uncharacterized protein n=1 Tax=Cyanothece sp. (strain PCC 7425 / ATCC 29141) TaxID=395961 RepID=B8HWH3_CYAP4